jgi:hypothetical protein
VRHTLSVRQGGRKAANWLALGGGVISGIGVFAGGAGAAPCRMFSAPGRPPGDRSCHALPPRCPPTARTRRRNRLAGQEVDGRRGAGRRKPHALRWQRPVDNKN